MQKALVIEDNPDALRLIHYVLRRHGYDVLEAGSGEEALERAQSDLPDLVLLDINLPGIDGFETARRLRALAGGWADVPIIALTAVSMRGEREKILAAGCNGYLEKPYDPLQLIHQIRDITGER